MIGHYDWRGGREAMLRFGPADGPVVIAAHGLFEEANRTRAFTVAILRALAERGIAGVLPDLPGTGESLIATQDARLGDWRDAHVAAAAATGAHFAIAIRGGALIDLGFQHRWHFAPADGARLVRALVRTRQAAARETGEPFDPAELAPPGPPIALAGNLLSRDLLAELQATTPGTASRTLRLDTDPADADRKLPGAPLWRRAEPDNDPALAETLAADIAGWVRSCAA